MRRSFLTALLLVLAAPAVAASWLDTLPMPDALLASRDEIHKAVMALEADPLHENADLARAMLMPHFKDDVDYLICGTVLGPIAENKTLHPVMFQIIMASGDWVESHPEQKDDIDAYTLAGLESGVRAYRKLLEAKPKARAKIMDELSAQEAAGTLSDWNKAHPCRPQDTGA